MDAIDPVVCHWCHRLMSVRFCKGGVLNEGEVVDCPTGKPKQHPLSFICNHCKGCPKCSIAVGLTVAHAPPETGPGCRFQAKAPPAVADQYGI